MLCMKRCGQRLEAFEQTFAEAKHYALNTQLIDQTSASCERDTPHVKDEEQHTSDDKSAPSLCRQDVIYDPPHQQWYSHHQGAEREDAA
jgi:hypothetical protein